MAADTQFLGPDTENLYTAAADLGPGAIVQLPDSRAGQVMSTKGLLTGEVGKVRTCGRVRVNKLSTAVFSAGDVVDWDNGNDEAVVDGGTGEFMVGIAEKDAASGETTVDILLNGRAITT